MSFNFGNPPKTATAFSLASSSAPATTAATGFQMNPSAGGDTKTLLQNKPTTGLFGAPVANAPPSGLFGKPTSTSATGFSFGSNAPSTASTAPSLSFGATPATAAGVPTLLGTTSAASTLKFGMGTTGATTSSTTFAPILPSATTVGTSLTSTVSAAPTLNFSLTTTTATSATSSVPSLSLGATSTVTTSSAATTLPTTGTDAITFGQLEDSINKWTIDLEEQGKFFINQAKQLNAWDTLLISNGEKILNLNSSIERVKQQQTQLDHELDFVLAQQRELEELIAPLEKELMEIPVTDIDRNQMYQFSEMVDSQLKQMSEDLKEIIEHINEVQKNEESTNPITQIGKILNAHMNSLQWIDKNTSEISVHLEQISKLQDTNRKNLALNNSYNM